MRIKYKTFTCRLYLRCKILQMDRYDDIPLWLAYRDGDSDALGALAERYYRTLLRYGLKFGADQCTVEDCIQSLFLDLWQNRTRISATPSVKFYLLKALRRSIIHSLNYQQRFKYIGGADWELSFPEHFNAETYHIEKESFSAITSQLYAQLASLPKREREVIYLRYYENLEVHEISEIMGINRQSVSNSLQKALAKLRARWIPTLALYMVFFLKNLTN